jgi:hypothetical protein
VQRPTPAEYKEYLEQKSARSKRENEQSWREHLQREAHKRMQKEEAEGERIKKSEECKRASEAKVKEERSKEAACRAHERQEIAAQIRMAKDHIKEQQLKYLQALGHNEEDTGSPQHMVDLGWTMKVGVSICFFCEEKIEH